MDSADPTEQRDQLIGRVVDEYFQELEAGRRPKLSELVERYPEIAEVLKTVIPAMQASAPDDSRVSGEERMLGDFRILRQIGRGGMGVVYQAEQISMKRHVALKVLPLAGLLDEPKIQRFQSEVRAVASLDHPHIVSVYSVGEERGTHFFAMQLIRGSSLAEVIRELRIARDDDAVPQKETNQIVSSILAGRELSATDDYDSDAAAKFNVETIVNNNSSTIPNQTQREYFRSVVALVIQAADALEHAHGRGIVHRDIKPANLLLDSKSRLYVTDFGLAQIEADAGATMTGDLLGTLRYMAPEQTLAKRVSIDHRADVYSLGATLYELLALQPAFPSNDRHKLLKQVAFEDPKQLRRIDPSIPGDLETIVQKSMSKDRDDRYETVQAFGDDLARYLDHRPILARRPGPIQVVSKWIGRHPVVAFASVAVLSLVAVMFAVNNAVVTQQRDNSRLQFQRANVTRLAAESRALLSERPSLSTLLAIEAVSASNRDPVSETIAHEALLNASQRLPRAQTLQGHGTRVSQVLMSKRWLITLGEGRLHLWNLLSPVGSPLVLGDDAAVRTMSLSKDGRWLVALGNKVQRWDLDSPNSPLTIPADPDAQAGKLSVDGKMLAIIEKSGQASVWDCSTTQPKRIRTLAHPDDKIGLLEISLDGRHIITTSNASQPYALQWDLENPEAKPRSLDGILNPVVAVVQNSNGREFATVGRKRVQFWDAVTSASQATRVVDYDGPYASTRLISPDFRHLFTRQAYTSRLNCFDLSAVEPATTVAELKGHTIDISQLAVTHDGDSFVSAARDGTVRFWDLKAWPPQSKRIFHAHDAVISLALHDEGRWMATAGADGVARLWDLSRPESSDALHVLDSHDDYSFSSTAVSLTGRWIATTVRGNRFQLWDVESDNPSTFCRVLENPTSAFSELAISANDRWLVASCHDGSLQVWDLAASDLPSSRKILPPPQDLELVEGDGGARLAVGPNGRWIAVSYGSHTRLWDLAAREPTVTNLQGHNTEIVSIAISSNGRWLASGARDSLRLWDLSTGAREKTGTLLYENSSFWSLTFDQHGRYLYAAGDRDVERWDLDDLSAERLSIEPTSSTWGNIWRMGISKDSSRMVTARFSRHAQLWDMRGDTPIPFRLPTYIGVQCVAFSPDNRWLATGTPSNARLWDLTAEDPTKTARVLRGHLENVWSIGFSGDSRWLVTDASDGKIRRWCLDTPWLIEQSRKVVGRELTDEERLQYGLESVE